MNKSIIHSFYILSGCVCIFCHKEIGENAARKMLVKLTSWGSSFNFKFISCYLAFVLNSPPVCQVCRTFYFLFFSPISSLVSLWHLTSALKCPKPTFEHTRTHTHEHTHTHASSTRNLLGYNSMWRWCSSTLNFSHREKCVCAEE